MSTNSFVIGKASEVVSFIVPSKFNMLKNSGNRL